MNLLPVLAELHFNPATIPVIVVAIAAAGCLVIGLATMCFQNEEKQRWHETARLALEKGQPIPLKPEFEVPSQAVSGHRKRMGLVTAGLVNLAVAAAVYLVLSGIPGAQVARKFMAIPALIGVALLASAALDYTFAPREPGRGASDRL
jgi:hypothetical protein